MSPSEPFLLWDESLSPSVVADISAATGLAIATVREEWRGRNFSVDPVRDDEIIRHLGGMGRHPVFWITQDWKALRKFRELMDEQGISVLWLRGPGGRSLKPREQLLMAATTMDAVCRMAMDRDTPVYLRIRFDPGGASRPMLERLAGGLLESPRRWLPPWPG